MRRSYERHLPFIDRCDFLLFRAPVDLAPGEHQKEHTEHEIEPGKPDEGEDGVAITDYLAITVARAKEPINQPRLPAQFGGHPTEGVGDVWIRKGQHEKP